MTAVRRCTEFCDHDTLHRRWAHVSLGCWRHESAYALRSVVAVVVEPVSVPVPVPATPGSGHSFQLMLVGQRPRQNNPWREQGQRRVVLYCVVLRCAVLCFRGSAGKGEGGEGEGEEKREAASRCTAGKGCD